MLRFCSNLLVHADQYSEDVEPNTFFDNCTIDSMIFNLFGGEFCRIQVATRSTTILPRVGGNVQSYFRSTTILPRVDGNVIRRL